MEINTFWFGGGTDEPRDHSMGSICLGGSKLMQMYGHLRDFRCTSALFGLVI